MLHEGHNAVQQDQIGNLVDGDWESGLAILRPKNPVAVSFQDPVYEWADYSSPSMIRISGIIAHLKSFVIALPPRVKLIA